VAVSSRLLRAYCHKFSDSEPVPASGEIKVPWDVSSTVLQEFRNACEGREYEIADDTAADFLSLSDFFEAETISQAIISFMSESSTSIRLLVSSIKSRLKRNADASDLETALRDQFLDAIPNPILYDLPLSILSRVIPHDFPGEKARDLFQFLMDSFQKYGTASSLLFSVIDVGKLDSSMLAQPMAEERFVWSFIGSSFGQVLSRFVEGNLRISAETSEQALTNRDTIQRHDTEMRQLKEEVQQLTRRIDEMSARFDKESNGLREVMESRLSARDAQTAQLQTDIESLKNPRIIPPDPYQPLNGIIAYLTRKSGGNVHGKGIVTITGCKERSDGPAKNAADLTVDSYFCSLNEPNQSLCYDFKNMGVRPTHYSIRSCFGGRVNYHNLKDWVIEGSNDGQSWVEVDCRENNNELNDRNVTRTFSTARQELVHMIRLRQTGLDHNGHHHIVISSFEIFGSLIE
jgi:hypothetical protein